MGLTDSNSAVKVGLVANLNYETMMKAPFLDVPAVLSLMSEEILRIFSVQRNWTDPISESRIATELKYI